MTVSYVYIVLNLMYPIIHISPVKNSFGTYLILINGVKDHTGQQ